MAPFECDLDPETRNPRIRMTFNNGLTVSIVYLTGADGINAPLASVAMMKDRKVINMPGFMAQQEAFPDEVAAFIAAVAAQRADG